MKKSNIISNEWSYSQFYSGSTALSFVESNQYNKLFGSSARYNYSSFAMPSNTETDKGTSILKIDSLAVVNSNDENQINKACKFIEYCITDKNFQLKYNESNNTIPTLISAQKDSAYSTREWKTFINQLKYSKCRPAVSGYNVISTYIYEALKEIISDEKSCSESLETAQIRTDYRLGRN